MLQTCFDPHIVMTTFPCNVSAVVVPGMYNGFFSWGIENMPSRNDPHGFWTCVSHYDHCSFVAQTGHGNFLNNYQQTWWKNKTFGWEIFLRHLCNTEYYVSKHSINIYLNILICIINCWEVYDELYEVDNMISIQMQWLECLETNWQASAWVLFMFMSISRAVRSQPQPVSCSSSLLFD